MKQIEIQIRLEN